MRWIAAFLICVVALLYGCTEKSIREPYQSAQTKIQEWDAAPHNDDWIVTVWYDLINTGTLEITGYSVRVTIDVEGSKEVIADCWGPSNTVEDYRLKKSGEPIPPGSTERCVIVLNIPYKPMRVSMEFAAFK